MKKFITLILAFIITISCTITSSFADSNLIFDILNKPTNTNSGIEVIDNILGKKKDTKVKIKIVNENRENKTLKVKKGEAFAQGIFFPYFLTDDDNVTEIRTGGIGSTNK